MCTADMLLHRPEALLLFHHVSSCPYSVYRIPCGASSDVRGSSSSIRRLHRRAMTYTCAALSACGQVMITQRADNDIVLVGDGERRGKWWWHVRQWRRRPAELENGQWRARSCTMWSRSSLQAAECPKESLGRFWGLEESVAVLECGAMS